MICGTYSSREAHNPLLIACDNNILQITTWYVFQNDNPDLWMFKSSLFGVYIVHIRKDRNIKLVNLQFQLRKQQQHWYSWRRAREIMTYMNDSYICRNFHHLKSFPISILKSMHNMNSHINADRQTHTHT